VTVFVSCYPIWYPAFAPRFQVACSPYSYSDGIPSFPSLLHGNIFHTPTSSISIDIDVDLGSNPILVQFFGFNYRSVPPLPSASIIWTPVVLFLVVTIWRYNTTYTTTSYLPPILTARCRELGLGSLPERLKGDLQSGTRVWNLELLENRGVQYPDATKLDVGVRTQRGLDAFLDGSETGVLLG